MVKNIHKSIQQSIICNQIHPQSPKQIPPFGGVLVARLPHVPSLRAPPRHWSRPWFALCCLAAPAQAVANSGLTMGYMVWYTIYIHLYPSISIYIHLSSNKPVVEGVSSTPSFNQPTNGKRTSMG